MFNFGIFRDSFGHFYTLTGFQCIYVHNSNLNYMRMLQCRKMGLHIKSLSLGACLGPMQEMGMNFKHQGTVDCRKNVEILCF